jgi:hypothetical protein
VVSTLVVYAMLLRELHRNGEARRLEARVRALRAKADSDNPARFEVDWTDLRQPAKWLLWAHGLPLVLLDLVLRFLLKTDERQDSA